MFFIRMFIKLLCIIVHRIFLFGVVPVLHSCGSTDPGGREPGLIIYASLTAAHLHPWDFFGKIDCSLSDSLFCNSKMRTSRVSVYAKKKKKSGHTYLRVCRPEAFKAINNSVLLYLTLSLVKKRKKKRNKIHTVWEHLKQIPLGLSPNSNSLLPIFFFNNFYLAGAEISHT